MSTVRKPDGSIPIRALAACSLSVHRAVNGYLMTTLGSTGGGKSTGQSTSNADDPEQVSSLTGTPPTYESTRYLTPITSMIG